MCPFCLDLIDRDVLMTKASPKAGPVMNELNSYFIVNKG